MPNAKLKPVVDLVRFRPLLCCALCMYLRASATGTACERPDGPAYTPSDADLAFWTRCRYARGVYEEDPNRI